MTIYRSFWTIIKEAPDGVKTWHYSAFMEINMLNAAQRITGTTGNYHEARERWNNLIKKEISETYWTLYDARYNSTIEVFMQDEMPPIEEEAPGHPNTKVFDARSIDLRRQAWLQEQELEKARKSRRIMPTQINLGI